MQILLVKKLKQEIKMKNKKRNITIALIVIIAAIFILIVSYIINENSKMYKARKDIDEVASQKNIDNDKEADEAFLLLDNIYESIDLTINKIKESDINVTPETTDTLFTIIQDNLHFVELLNSEKVKHNIFSKNWQDSLRIVLLQEKNDAEYVEKLNKIKDEIKEFQKGL